MNREVADQIITSRLLVMQSKRLMLTSAQRRLEKAESVSVEQKVARLSRETEAANHAYRTAVLSLGSPDDRVYWVVAYGRLIDVGRTLAQRLRKATPDLPPPERYEVSADAEMLEEIVAGWSESMKGSMVGAIA
jgi:hypothetical protein